MVDEIDRIVKGFPEFDYDWQQFVETAVREKIEKMRLIERAMVEKE